MRTFSIWYRTWGMPYGRVIARVFPDEREREQPWYNALPVRSIEFQGTGSPLFTVRVRLENRAETLVDSFNNPM